MCKHVLAARLAVALDRCKDIEVAANDLAKLYGGLD
jgi:predicted nucleic acid-binding Zn finger protein